MDILNMLKIVIIVSLLSSCLGKNMYMNNTRLSGEFVGGRIIGGVDTDIAKYPYQVSIEYKTKHACGGSIISPCCLVTAAHCVEGKTAETLQIRSGSTYKEHGGSLHQPCSIIIHPRYNDKYDFDIAVIKVSNRFLFSSSVKSIPITLHIPPAGTAVVVTGWGVSSEVCTPSGVLQKVEMFIRTRKECMEQYANETNVYPFTPRMICAGMPKGNKNVCSSESGGPLVSKGQLNGIVSWGFEFCDKHYLGVYTNVAMLKNWIDSVECK